MDPWCDLPLEPRLELALKAVRAGDLDGYKKLAAAGGVAVMIHGRQALQVHREAPPGEAWEPYRLAGVFEYGDWQRIDEEPWSPEARATLEKWREVLLAPLESNAADPGIARLQHDNLLFAGEARQARQCLIRTSKQASPWGSVPMTQRLAGYLRLEETVMLAWAEMVAGRLAHSAALAQRADKLGPPEDQQHVSATDLLAFLQLARGQSQHAKLGAPAMLAGPRGPAPLDTCLWLLELCLLSALVEPNALEERAQTARAIAARLGSPRLIAIAEAWRSAARLTVGDDPGPSTEVAAQLRLIPSSARGLRALPLFVSGVANRRSDHLGESARLARATGQGWLEVAALAWLVHLGAERVGRGLHRLLQVSGWRAPMLVPRNVHADVATQLAAGGERSVAIIEFALASRDEKVVSSVASAHLRDEACASEVYERAASALARVGRPEARELLRAIASSRAAAAPAATAALAHRNDRLGLSTRESDVLRLAADGRTNSQIAAALTISPHTVARHLENSRNKLGAANRAEAVALWLTSRDRPGPVGG